MSLISFTKKALLPGTESGAIKPYKLNFVVTKECHSKCLNCHIWKEVPKNELTLSEINQIAANSPFLSWINFTGGEPTDRKDFPQIVKAFIDQCPDLYLIHFPTNGLNTKRIIAASETILEYNPPNLMVTVSFDGPPEVHDQLRGVKGNFHQSINTMKKLLELGSPLQVFVGMTLYPENHHLISETIQSIAERIPLFNPEHFHINLPNISEHFYGNQEQTKPPSTSMLESLTLYRKNRKFSLSPMNWIERRYEMLAKEFLKTGKTPLECAAMLTSCFLSAQGELFPCTIWNQPLGSVKQTNYNLLPLLNSPQALQLREKIETKNCPNCWTPCEAYQTILANVV